MVSLRTSDFEYEQQEYLGLIRFSSPESLNGFTLENLDDFYHLISYFEKQTTIKAIVILGGDKHFCSGGSMQLLQDMIDSSTQGRKQILAKAQRLIKSIKSSPCRIVAGVDGLVAGAGIDLMLACDYRYIGPKTRANYSFNRLNMVPDLGSLFLLAQYVGPQRALDFYNQSPTWRQKSLGELGLGESIEMLPTNTDDWLARLDPILITSKQAYASAKASLWSVYASQYEQHLQCITDAVCNLLDSKELLQAVARTTAVQHTVRKRA